MVLSLREHPRVHLHEPSWYSLLCTKAVWGSRWLLGYKPAQHVTAQNSMRLNQAQEKMMRSRDTRCTRLLLAQRGTLFYSKFFNKSIYTIIMIKSIVNTWSSNGHLVSLWSIMYGTGLYVLYFYMPGSIVGWFTPAAPVMRCATTLWWLQRH